MIPQMVLDLSVCHLTRGLICNQQAPSPSCGIFRAGIVGASRNHAALAPQARRSQTPLAFDLDHTGAASPVRAIPASGVKHRCGIFAATIGDFQMVSRHRASPFSPSSVEFNLVRQWKPPGTAIHSIGQEHLHVGMFDKSSATLAPFFAHAFPYCGAGACGAHKSSLRTHVRGQPFAKPSRKVPFAINCRNRKEKAAPCRHITFNPPAVRQIHSSQRNEIQFMKQCSKPDPWSMETGRVGSWPSQSPAAVGNASYAAL